MYCVYRPLKIDNLSPYDACCVFQRCVSHLFCTAVDAVQQNNKKRVLYVVLKCFPVGLFKLSLTVLKQEIEVRQTLSIESIDIYPCIAVVDYKQLVEICLFVFVKLRISIMI